MGFDHRRLAAYAAFHHIRVDGSLYQKIYSADFFRFLLKHTDKFLANNLKLMLRLLYTFQLLIETLLVRILVKRTTQRKTVGETDTGIKLKERIAELEELLEAYRNGLLIERL